MKVCHSEKSLNFLTTTKANTIKKNPANSGKTFFDISVNTGQICMGFKADTPEKWQQQANHKQLLDKDLVKKLLTSKRKTF